MEKSRQENLINNNQTIIPSTDIESGWKKKLEEENQEVSVLYNALHKKTLEVFGVEDKSKEVNEQWREIVKDYDAIQIEPDKEKRDNLLKSFLERRMKELEEIERQRKESGVKES